MVCVESGTLAEKRMFDSLSGSHAAHSDGISTVDVENKIF